MRNPRHRENQRAYKYQEQQRVPEFFGDYDEYYSFLEEEYSQYTYVCNQDDCRVCGRGIYSIPKKENLEDWISVDSADDHETNNSLLSLNEEETSLDTVEDKQGPQVCLNRVEEKQVNSSKEDIFNDKMVDDESDWNVYHSKYAKKQMKMSKRRKAEVLALNESLSMYNLAVHKWIDSWCNDDRQASGSSSYDDEVSIINTDGFFRKNRKAGYGVIIRSRSGVPMVGSAGFYTQGKPVSALYHELQGINRGLELAIKYGLCHNVVVYCSSKLAAYLVESRFRCTCDDRDHNSTLHIVCKICIKDYIPDCSEEDFQLLIYPLIQEIVENSCMFSFTIYGIKRRQNRAADYLAKLQLNNEEINPQEFPQELKAILYDDAQGGDLINQYWIQNQLD